MKSVVIKEYTGYVESEILPLYKSVGWSAYYSDPARLQWAFAGSLCVFAAYAGGQLIGLIRVVGDGVSVVFIQDVLVMPEYQRRGIGRKLVAQVLRAIGMCGRST